MNTQERGALASVVLGTIAAVAVVFALGGCSSSKIVAKVVEVAAKPVLGLAVKDARTTLLWIDQEVAAQRMSPPNEVLARLCPDAVIALDTLRAEMTGETAPKIDGFKGLIYLGTTARFGMSSKAEAVAHLQGLIQSCAPLIPADKLILGF